MKGKGAFIDELKINQDFLIEQESFQKQMEKKGLRPKTRVLQFRLMPADTRAALQYIEAAAFEHMFLYRVSTQSILNIRFIPHRDPAPSLPAYGKSFPPFARVLRTSGTNAATRRMRFVLHR